jgi:oxygen-dependent protoporphyrinogen oxidase
VEVGTRELTFFDHVIIIIGAGITGLAAAYELTRRRAPFTVLDAARRSGGLVHTERSGGFTIDAGADSLLVQKPAAIQLCQELGLGPRLMRSVSPRTAFVLRRGRLHALPSPSVLGLPTALTAIARYDLLSWMARARLALEPLVPSRKHADESVASFFRRRFGSSTVDLIAEPLLGGIHAGDIERLSMPSLFPRLVEAERRPARVLHTLARNHQPAPDGLFRALRGGMSEMVTALESALPPGALRLDAAVTRVERTSSGWTVEAGGVRTGATAVIVAAPAHAAAAFLQPVDAAVAQICATVPYVSTASVALGFRRTDILHPLAGSGFVVVRRDNDVRITACTWVSSKWEDRAPDGHVLLRTFLGGAHDPGAVDTSDEALIDASVRDVAAVLKITAPPVFSRVYRWPNAGAQHNVGHRARMAGLAERLKSLPGLFVAGSGFDSIGIPDCVANGRRAAAAAADYATIRI